MTGLTQGCVFSGFGWYFSPFRGSNCPETPILGAWIGTFQPNCQILKCSYYKNYCIDHNQILQNDRDPKYSLWVDQICPKEIRDGRLSPSRKIEKILISSKSIDRFWPNLACWCVSTLWTPISIFYANGVRFFMMYILAYCCSLL